MTPLAFAVSAIAGSLAAIALVLLLAAVAAS